MFNRGAKSLSLFDADLQYIGTTVNTTNLTNYTFSGVDIGVASDDRMVVVCAITNYARSSITIGGVSATFISGGNCSIAYLKVATGTTADIVVNTAGTNANCRIFVYTVQVLGEVPLDTAIGYGNPVSSLTLSDIETRPYGCVISCLRFNDGGGLSIDWSGIDDIVTDHNALTEPQRMFSCHIDTSQFSDTNDLTYTRLSGTSAISAAAISF